MKSEVKEAKLTKRYVTGQYEHEEYTLTAEVLGGESGVKVLTELKLQINEAFIGEASVESEAEEEVQEKPKTKKGKKENGKRKSSIVSDEDEGDSDSAEEADDNEDESADHDEATDSEDGNASDDSSDESEEDSEDEEDGEEDAKPVKGKADKGGKAGTKVRKAKPQNYNREVEQHKSLFSGVLRSVAPEWNKSDDSKARAKKTSVQLAGKPFLDADGEVLDSFKAEVKKLMLPVKKSK